MSDNLESIQDEKTKKSNGAFLAIIILLGLACAFLAYLWNDKNNKLNDATNLNLKLKADNEMMNQMMAGYVDNMSNDLRKDLQSMMDTYDVLLEKGSEQNDSLMAQRQQIETMMNDMEQLRRQNRLSGSKLAAMKKENETLRRIMKSYVIQIDSLNTNLLMTRNDLKSTKNELSTTVNERDQYKTEAERNADMVKKGQVLQAYNFVSGGLRMKLNNTTTETNRASRTVQIRSSFTLSENPLTPKGQKTVYMQIIAPSGKTLQNRTSNVVDTDNGPIAFSDKKEINYTNQRLDISIYYDFRGEDADKGNYKVNIYIAGALVGSDSFTLK